MSASASGASTGANGEAKHRGHNDGSSSRAYTVEQKAAVIRVRRCQATAFYDILGLETVKTTCTDSEIKKAYRKLSLLTHPDKNGYDGADEAFKMVSRAFGILSDPDKKASFDKFGGDPDSRSGGGGPAASPFSGFSQGARRGNMYEADISPEEMFARFFGGGGMGGGFGGPFGMFDTGPGFAFNMGGGPGIRVHQFGGARPQRRPRDPNAPQPTMWQSLQSLLPILIVFLFPLISHLMGVLFPDPPPGPSVRFNAPTPPYTLAHSSHRLKVPYWVNPVDVEGYSARDWRKLDDSAEKQVLTRLQYECEAENDRRQRLIEDAMGFWFTDNEKLQKAREMAMPACARLEGWGYRGRR